MIIIAIAVVAFILIAVIIGLLVWAFSEEKCELDCTKDAILGKVQNYYNLEGAWKGKYTMTPTKGVLVEPAEGDDSIACDIAYDYAPVPGTGGSTGTDKRRFSFEKKEDKCDWTVTAMGDNMSGVTV